MHPTHSSLPSSSVHLRAPNSQGPSRTQVLRRCLLTLRLNSRSFQHPPDLREIDPSLRYRPNTEPQLATVGSTIGLTQEPNRGSLPTGLRNQSLPKASRASLGLQQIASRVGKYKPEQPREFSLDPGAGSYSPTNCYFKRTVESLWHEAKLE